MAEGSQPPVLGADLPSLPGGPGGATATGPAYEAALKLLTVLATLPTRIVGVTTERELREIVRDTVVDLLGPVDRFELFVSEGPNGTLVPAAADARAGLALLAGLVTAGAALDHATIAPSTSAEHGDLLSAPLHDRQQTIGLVIVEAPADRRFVAADLDAVHAVAAQIALALQRLHIERRSAAQLRMERDMVLAREVQRRFLPAPLPPGSRLRVNAHYRPAFDVGGDFYDLVSHGDGAVSAVIGDVSGKGVAAALLMSRLASDLRRFGPPAESPRTLLHELQRLIEMDAPDDTFATVACVRFDPARGRALVANAGHVPPLLRRANGQVAPFGRASGPPLGVTTSQFYADEEIALAPGDMIFLMTDGLVEALDRPGDHLGMRLLLSLIADAPSDLDLIQQRILAAVERERLMRQVDDVTLVAIEITAPAP
jgi:serine phosphatase RsbU (regulator of sigma subunit)